MKCPCEEKEYISELGWTILQSIWWPQTPISKIYVLNVVVHLPIRSCFLEMQTNSVERLARFGDICSRHHETKPRKCYLYSTFITGKLNVLYIEVHKATSDRIY